ncbi:30011_t:CDS:2, partial [Gigaspora margarita]
NASTNKVMEGRIRYFEAVNVLGDVELDDKQDLELLWDLAEADSIKLLYFQYPCKYGIECSGYYSEANKVSYKDTEMLNEALIDIKINLNIPTYQITKKESELPLLQPLTFQHLAEFKQIHNIEQLQEPKQKYGFRMGYAKKAFDLAIRANKGTEAFNDNISTLQESETK